MCAKVVKCKEGKKADRISVKGYVATGTPSLGWYIGCIFKKHYIFIVLASDILRRLLLPNPHSADLIVLQ